MHALTLLIIVYIVVPYVISNRLPSCGSPVGCKCYDKYVLCYGNYSGDDIPSFGKTSRTFTAVSYIYIDLYIIIIINLSI